MKTKTYRTHKLTAEDTDINTSRNLTNSIYSLHGKRDSVAAIQLVLAAQSWDCTVAQLVADEVEAES